MKKALAFGLLMTLVVGVGPVSAEEAAGTQGPSQAQGKATWPGHYMISGKPEAPIEIRWLADGRDGKVALEIVSGVDQVSAVVRLTLPGQGSPREVQLPAAQAGQVQRVQWWLDEPAKHPPRIFVEIDTGQSRMPRRAIAPWSRGKNREIRAEFDARRDPGAVGTEKSDAESGIGPPDSVTPLPAQQTIRPRQD